MHVERFDHHGQDLGSMYSGLSARNCLRIDRPHGERTTLFTAISV
jgi:hypothetical protein